MTMRPTLPSMAPSRKPPSKSIQIARRSARQTSRGDRSVKLARLAMVAVLATFWAAGTSSAQQKSPKAKGQGQGQGQGQAQTQPTPAPPSPSGTPAAPAQPGWAARCSSPSRDAPLECAMEQNAILTKTGQ